MTGLPKTKREWFDDLCAKKRANLYTENEVAAYRAQLERKYANITDAEFAHVMSLKETR